MGQGLQEQMEKYQRSGLEKAGRVNVLLFFYTVVHKTVSLQGELQQYPAVTLTSMFSLSCRANDVSTSEMCHNENAN